MFKGRECRERGRGCHCKRLKRIWPCLLKHLYINAQGYITLCVCHRRIRLRSWVLASGCAVPVLLLRVMDCAA
jgi:hypothetical protein